MNSHELVQLLKDKAIELGRTPRKHEFIPHIKGGEYQLAKLFGTYTQLLQAAGLDTYDQTRGQNPKKKLDNSIFLKSLEAELEKYVPRPSNQKKDISPTLIIPDTHFPFASQRVLDAIYEWASKYKPVRVIQVGDLYDLYAHSKFARSLNIYQPKEEEEIGRKQAEAMWKTIQGIVPKAECVQLIGNHDLRPLRQTLQHLPSLEHVVEKYLHERMTFEGVKLISDAREEYVFDGIHTFHGYRSGFGSHLMHAMRNTIHGHDHKLGVAFKRVREELIWELHSGFAGDMESKVFHYTPQKSTQEMPGFGWVEGPGPRAIPV
jgi:hypothetical protein